VLQLARHDHFPDELLEAPAHELWRRLGASALFSVPGRARAPLFVSVLLHGDEDTGWRAIQSVLRRHRGALLPRSLLLFVGNVAAASERVRTLPGQEDYNRAWPGTEQPASATAQLLRTVFDLVAAAAPFASIDIHNNSGRNPHYACVSDLGERHLQLARLFGRTVVYYERPAGVQSAALARLCPAIVVECGRAGEQAGVEHAAELVESALALREFPSHPVPDHDLDLLRTMAIVRVPPRASMCFGAGRADFQFRADLDLLNFSELDSGTSFGSLGEGAAQRLEVLPTHDAAPRAGYFSYDAGEIRLARPAIPAMLSLSERAVRLDCLGYLMQRIGRDGLPYAGAGGTA
jgi:succinylglutamate desuccinylase